MDLPRLIRRTIMPLAACLVLLGLPPSARAQEIPGEILPAGCSRMVYADVVALDQSFFWNRLGAVEPQGMMYALRRDVVNVNQDESSCDTRELPLEPGGVKLRRHKRARPLVLRMNVGDCLRIDFENLLQPDVTQIDDKSPRTRAASIHVAGLQYVTSQADGGMDVGTNGAAGDGVVPPGGRATYTLYAEREGTFLMYSGGALAGGEATSGSLSAGLFGAVNVEPASSEWYRSQVTRDDLELASTNKWDSSTFPVIDYGATYTDATDPYQCRRVGTPILKMLDAGNNIVHSDLTAIITGPNAGAFGAGYPYATTPTYPDRQEPYREFTIIFHDEVGAVQAFAQFEDPAFKYTLHSVREAFAINYGTAGAGAEVLANRLGVGPMFDCKECKYEEFFLTSWAVGDPAMVVDVPANAPCSPSQISTGSCTPTKGRKATKAYYPDDPSNVYHSYLNDHVKFRNLLAGSDDHHIFHLHAHQWLHTPRADKSSYMDSQAIGQGTGYTYEIAHNGSGNLNRTVGDSIFHCHFYPHFAQGMWSLWRVHDVLETGTELDGTGRPAAGSRALPDNEILAGTPIPALVPIPVLPMAPLPGPVSIVAGQVQLPAPVTTNPGYPFFVPGKAGHRPPQPPLDTIDDGGLPRHVAVGGTAVSTETRWDFSKLIQTLDVNWLLETGEPVETVAMNFHATPGGFATPTPTGAAATKPFKVNGTAPVRGAPFADPCIDASGRPVTNLRTYKGADIQLDLKINKAGWHVPQARIISLWEDVNDTINGVKPPEPLFFRANSGECVEYHFTNLVPSEYHLDDFQVRTPTDVLGQHIHLVKFDVMASDGGGNGFNYEDGSFSPEEVQERIHAIRAFNGCDLAGAPASLVADKTKCPEPEVHPFFNKFHDTDCDGENDWLGAQTTVQRWYVDPITMLQGGQRTMRTVFSHDHFGPSSHQQTGLYAGLVVEPPGSTWSHNETGAPLGTRADGGPTSWQAVVSGPSERETYREFLLEFADFQLAYEPGSPVCPDLSKGGRGWADPLRAINPAGRKRVGPPDMYHKPITVGACPESGLAPPCPEAVSADDPGTGTVNYRSEPVALRVRDPLSNSQAPNGPGQPGDLSWAYASRTDRLDPLFNVQPGFYPPLTADVQPGDPFTPLLRAYEGDALRIRILVGAHEEEHGFTIHGMKWLFEPDDVNSGYRNGQMMGISEWFDFDIPPMPSLLQDGDFMDALYKPSAASEFQWNGVWGLLRFYHGARPDLRPLPTNFDAKVDVDTKLENYRTLDAAAARDLGVVNTDAESGTSGEGSVGFTGGASTVGTKALVPGVTAAQQVPVACPSTAPLRTYDITAVAAFEAMAADGNPVPGLVYNYRPDAVNTYFQPDWDGGGEPAQRFGPLHDPTAIMFVRTPDLLYVPGPGGVLRPRINPGVRREPLILRANKGECIQVTLRNDLPGNYFDLPGWNSMPMIVERFNANSVRPSWEVGLHPQLVYTDLRRGDGANVGLNPIRFGKQTVAPGQKITYHWFAGEFDVDQSVTPEVLTPIGIEFGASGLTSSDPIKHTNKGAVGAMIIEPSNANWVEDVDAKGVLTHASVTVNPNTSTAFREFVAIYQDDVNLRFADNAPVESLLVNEDPTESAQKAFNYRTDPIWYRIGFAPDTDLHVTNDYPFFDQVLTNAFIGGADPETPVFEASRGVATRFRVIHPGGHTQAHAFEIQGHIWEELPYTASSRTLGTNPASEWIGIRGTVGPTCHFDALLKHGAGGKFGVTGDYLYRDYPAWQFYDGIWGLLRVQP